MSCDCGKMINPFSKSVSFVLDVRFTWKCSCPGTALWGNSGRNMAMKAGKLHSALSLSGPTPASLRTCSGMSGALPWSIRRRFSRRAGGARRQRVAGMDRPMLERKPRQPDESSSSDLWRGRQDRAAHSKDSFFFFFWMGERSSTSPWCSNLPQLSHTDTVWASISRQTCVLLENQVWTLISAVMLRWKQPSSAIEKNKQASAF